MAAMNSPQSGSIPPPAPPIVCSLACRPGCGACCIAPSITGPLPGMPGGKPAGVPCLHLLPDLRCAIFGRPERPACCGGLQPSVEMCGDNRDYALFWLARLEKLTAPD